MRQLNENDTIKMGVYCGMTVRECIKRYGKKALLEVLKYYDLNDELSRRFYHKKDGQKVEVQNFENKNEEYPYPWEGTASNNEDYFKTYDEMQSSEFDYSEDIDVFMLYEPEVCNYEPVELTEELMLREMKNKGYKFWIYG